MFRHMSNFFSIYGHKHVYLDCAQENATSGPAINIVFKEVNRDIHPNISTIYVKLLPVADILPVPNA